MKVKSFLITAIVAVLAIGFASSAFGAIGNQGRILYTKGVVRNPTDGTITSTGNLFVKDLATGAEQQITNYSGSYSILNPMFSADGKYIIFTSNVTVGGDSTFKVYIVSADATVNVGVGIELKSETTGVDYKYAALSPDGNTIAFVRVESGDSSLWTYDRKTGIYQQIYSNPINTIDIRQVVFVNATTLAFIGKSAGVQNIYLVDLTGPSTTRITNNTTNTVEYLSLKSASRSALAGNMLIYSKRVKSGASWGQNDIYATISLQPFLEISITQTSTQAEYEACFYGDDSVTRDVQLTAQSGNMFYIATVIGSSKKVWQANFDTTGGPTNTGKTQRTTDSAGDVGQVDWAPPVIEQAPVVGIGNTEMVYIANYNAVPEVWKAAFDTTGTLQPGTVISVYGTSSSAKDNPSLGYGRVACDEAGSAANKKDVDLLNSDGTNFTLNFDGLDGNTYVAMMPFITPDGKWIIFVADTLDNNGKLSNNKQLYAKRIIDPPTATPISISISGVVNAEDPIVSPDMSTLVWVDNNPGGMSTINKIGIQFNFDAGTVTTVGSTITLGGNTGQCNDRNPSFSPDGTKIIFVSDRDGSNRIYTMDAGTGLGVKPFTFTQPVTNPAYPRYSPLNDGSIAFVADGPGGRTIQLATAQGVVTDTGRLVDRDKFDWKIIRTAGEITATRTLQPRAATGTNLVYGIKIDIDDAKKPVSYTLEEVIPSWAVVSVEKDGGAANYSELDDTPVAGLKTLKFVFMNGLSGTGITGSVEDHILTITVTTAGSGTKSFSGTISYFMDGNAQSSLVTGNGTVILSNPYCPVDKYNSKKQANKPDGVIQDLDLLYAIEAWSTGAQLPGYGTGWPASPSTHWDNILLAVINIWASPAGTQGWYTGDQQVTNASTVAGEYQYVGPDEYQSGSGATPVDEMYWTQGQWQD